MSVSKAELKRRKDAKATMYTRLSVKMMDYKEMYLESCINYKTRRLEARLKRCKESTEEIFEGSYRTRMIASIEKQLERRHLLILSVINEANESYEAKLDKVIDKCINFGINNYMKMNVERVTNGTSSEFAFLISNDEIEVHARVIYAHGLINAPHFRFITTKRNK